MTKYAILIDDMLWEVNVKKGKIIGVGYIEEIQEYHHFDEVLEKEFNNFIKGEEFNLPYSYSGTPFQMKVWKVLLNIPHGETLTYSDVAGKVGNPMAYRAVANACGQNRLALIIPCHRVLAKNGIGGFGFGVKIKKKLLKIESN